MGRVLRSAVFQSFSLVVSGFVLFAIYCVYTGLTGSLVTISTTVLVICAVAFWYATVHHRFSKPTYRTLILVPLTVAFVGSIVFAIKSFRDTASPDLLKRAVEYDTINISSSEFLAEGWIAIPLILAGSLLLLGSVVGGRPSRYPKPTKIHEIATSPPYFGFASMFFGLWAVLFVGFALQRILIFAPIFEELLKFGVALTVGSTLFNRSILARIGVALVVGLLFGSIEHATTYPKESDMFYLFRVGFHSVTTMLSITIYTLLELRSIDRIRWIAPAYSIILHFFNNVFAVLWVVISVEIFGDQQGTVTIVYGFGTILLATGLLFVVFSSKRALLAIHEPLEHTLSDLV